MTVTYQQPITVAPETTVAHAAEVMEKAGVGSLLVVDDDRLVGIVTDRDLVLRGIGRRVPPDGRIDNVMTTGVKTLPVTTSREEIVRAFQALGVRRLPLMAGTRVAGLLTVDDLIADAVPAELPRLAALVRKEVHHPHHEAALPVPIDAPARPTSREPRPGGACVGDQIIVHGATIGEPNRDGEILETHTPAGDPPFRVRWADTGKVTFYFPGPDSKIRHLARR
jgi:CBS-domain-containing membrane protein